MAEAVRGRGLLARVLEACGGAGYQGSLLCGLVGAYAGGRVGEALRAARGFVEQIQELAGRFPLVFVSSGPRDHWLDSFRWLEREGLLPWACPFRAEEAGGERRRGGPHYALLLEGLAGGFVRGGGRVEVVAPLVVYYVSGSGVLGFGVAIWADASPARGPLWRGESCPPRGGKPCYTFRWYMLPLALACGGRELEAGGACSISGIDVGGANRSCAQRLAGKAQELVDRIASLLQRPEGRRLVENALRCLEAARVAALAAARPAASSPRGETEAAGGAAEPWSQLDVAVAAEKVRKMLLERGVYVEERLVKTTVYLVSGGNVMLAGPPGCGKTLLARLIAEAAGARLVVATCHAGWTRGDFVGGPVLGEGGLVWRSGVLLQALAGALGGERVLLLLDEVNRAEVDKVFGEFFTVFSSPSPEGWSLEALCDTVCSQYSEESLDGPAGVLCEACKPGKRRRLVEAGERLRIVATMNTVDYATVFSVGEAFGRRFYKLEFSLDQDADSILENEVGAAGRAAGGILGEEALRKLASPVAELRRSAGGGSEAPGLAVALAQLPLGPALVKDVIMTARGMLEKNVVEDDVCAVLQALRASIPITVLVDPESREKLEGAIRRMFGAGEARRCLGL